MSHPKITPKNLTYNTALPPFLQRLQSNHNASSPRHETPSARPKRQKDEGEERESEPVVFDEVSGETLSREEWERRDREREEVEEEKVDGEEDGEKKGEEVAKMAGTKTAVIGASKKRKVGRMIGGAGDEEEKEEKAGKADDGLLDGRKDNGKAGSGERSKAGTGEKKKGKVAAKKGKKIKLSFGDDEEELDSSI